MSEERLRALEDRCAMLEGRLERMFRPGTVSAVDYSDASKPRARITIGVDDEGGDVLGPMVPISTWAGERNEWHPVSPGQQMLHISPDGELETGLLVPYGHSNQIPAPETDPHTHVVKHGKTKETHKADSKDYLVGDSNYHLDLDTILEKTSKTITRAAGDAAAAAAGSALGSLINFPHELNRQLQGMRATLTQHDHHISALHDRMSMLNQIAMGAIPELAVLAPFLDGSPLGLKMSADAVLGKLEQYVASAVQQAVSKLTNGFLSNVEGLIGGLIDQEIGNVLGAVSNLASGAKLLTAITAGDAAVAAVQIIADDPIATAAAQAAARVAAEAPFAAATTAFRDKAASLVSEAQGLVGGLATDIAGVSGIMDQLHGALAGTNGLDALAGLAGRMSNALGPVGGLISGLDGMLDAQQDLVKGTIKSYLLGGYQH